MCMFQLSLGHTGRIDNTRLHRFLKDFSGPVGLPWAEKSDPGQSRTDEAEARQAATGNKKHLKTDFPIGSTLEVEIAWTSGDTWELAILNDTFDQHAVNGVRLALPERSDINKHVRGEDLAVAVQDMFLNEAREA